MEAVLTSARGCLATVRRYAPGHHQGRHTDPHSRISLLLRGAVREESRSGSLGVDPGEMLLKSRAVEHEDRFGEEGAVILSLEFREDDPFADQPSLWRKRADVRSVRLGATLIEAVMADDTLSVATIGADLVGEARSDRRRARRPPPWLLWLKEELEGAGLASVDVSSRAHDAGVHAAHASRLFRRCFGVSITEHAQLHAVRRAMAMLGRSDTALCDVAAAAGFYDQSHMTRVFHRVSGRPPGALRALTDGLIALRG